MRRIGGLRTAMGERIGIKELQPTMAAHAAICVRLWLEVTVFISGQTS